MKNITYATIFGTAVLALSGITQAATITFDDLAPTGNGISTAVTSDGFNFVGDHFHIIDTPDSRVVSSGSNYLSAEAALGLGRSVTMSHAGGSLFNLIGLEVGELWLPSESLNDFSDVILTGNQFGGGVLSTTIHLDGIRDGVGGVNDFQSEAIGWTNLVSVTITGMNSSGAFGDYSIDSINVSLVPEPETYALLLAGLGVVGAFAHRRKVEG
ncbi:FxDxF family PEP-CTERM protein [Nitrosomonas sp.]|uniref:FxDxF family PEP-CTERM protein n=1 Tax=Nitrosomonas sp. TaxID=42353 RepID=UPI001DE37A68|nr:FxDxF family PEP-CTERM protein [Nitrosomonas sp.]MBX3616498.1 PEP-CTERM sorting domain-containing protein [Nitrosomonas sp.]